MSYGAIIGDIAGSIYEFNPIPKDIDFDLFEPQRGFTDDSICTAAVADILLSDNRDSAAQVMRQWCRKYPNPMGAYGGFFGQWIYNSELGPYESYGNGSAMRVSPVAFLNHDQPIEKALADSDIVTQITHNHPEGIKGARATTHAIWLALQNERSDSIRVVIEREYNYDLSRTVNDIRPDYEFDVTCQGSVPEAIICALESSSFEDAIWNAVSLGGDADTQGAIAGAIAEAMYGIPEEIIDKGKSHLPQDIIEVMERLYTRIKSPPQ
ncbi:MAG: ADP-ribosylglycohydrolase family protein [Bacteroidetes bacterium]|nr:ADP-ribosylglycohydrolase family protein [Bacteroidota bacterium]